MNKLVTILKCNMHVYIPTSPFHKSGFVSINWLNLVVIKEAVLSWWFALDFCSWNLELFYIDKLEFSSLLPLAIPWSTSLHYRSLWIKLFDHCFDFVVHLETTPTILPLGTPGHCRILLSPTAFRRSCSMIAVPLEFLATEKSGPIELSGMLRLPS